MQTFSKRMNERHLEFRIPAGPSLMVIFLSMTLISGCGRKEAKDPADAVEVIESPALELDIIIDLVRGGEWSAAESALRRNISRSEHEVLSRTLLGYVLAEQGDLEGALEQYRINIEINPDDGDHFFNAGSVLRRMGKPMEAFEYYRNAGNLRAATPEILAYNMRLSLIEMGRSDELVEETARQLSVENPSGDWILTAAAISLDRGFVAEGAELLTLARNTIHPRFYAELVSDRFFRQYRGHPEIIEALNPPENTAPHLEQALNALGQGNFPLVVEAAQQAVRSGEPAAESRTLQGIALMQMEQYDASEAAFRAAIEAAPGISGGYLNLGELFRATERPSEAISAYRRADEIQPGNPRIHLKIGLAQLEAGEPVLADDFHPAAREALTVARALIDEDSRAVALALIPLRENHPDGWLQSVLSDPFFRQYAANPNLAPFYEALLAEGTSPLE